MDPVVFFVVGLLLIAIVLGPKYGAEDRPAFKNPDVKPRPTAVPSDWRSRF